jgi:hypothetical protein
MCYLYIYSPTLLYKVSECVRCMYVCNAIKYYNYIFGTADVHTDRWRPSTMLTSGIVGLKMAAILTEKVISVHCTVRKNLIVYLETLSVIVRCA